MISFSSIFLFLAGIISATNVKIKYNPESSIFYVKGKNIPAEGFFDPSSKDLENSFSNFIMNVHPLYKRLDIPYSLSNSSQSIDGQIVDLELLENCMLIDSHWASRGLDDKEIEPLLNAFWLGIGAFDYLKYDERTSKLIKSNDIIDDDIENVYDDNLPAAKVTKTKNSKRRNKSTTSSKPFCALMNPNLNLLRLTLEHPICQRALISSLHVLTSKEIATLFRNVPLTILDNPGLLDCIEDFSEFKGRDSVEKLAKIFEDKNQMITVAMAKTLPLKALYRVIEAKNFDVSAAEVNSLINFRFGFEFQEPFASDHRTFRLFISDEPILGLPPADLILKSIDTSRGLSPDVIESILAFYIRSEFGLQIQLSFISQNINNLELIAPVIDNMISLFSQRNRIINALISVDLRLANFIRIPLNQQIRSNNFDSTLKFLFTDADAKESLNLKVLRSTMSYNLTNIDAYEVFKLWNEVTENVSENFRKGRWARNFLQSLLGHLITDNEPRDQSLVEQAKTILSRHLGPQEYADFSFGKFDWFLLPIEDIMSMERGESIEDGVIWTYKITRELTKVLWNVDFYAEGVIEAIWTSQCAMTAIVSFPFCLNQDHVDALVQTEIGKELLKANPYLLQRLPSYSNFTVEEMEELNLTMDDLVMNIGTLNVEVGREWLKKQEYLVNSSVRTLYRPQMTIHSNSDSWSLITFESLRTSPSIAKDLNLVKGLSISEKLTDDLGIEEKLGLISRWLVHTETQIAWMWLLCRLPYFVTESMNIATETLIFTKLEASEIPKIIKNLKKDFKKTTDQEIKRKIHELMVILKERTISSFKAQLKSVHDNVVVVYERVKTDNEFICSLIKSGPGSDKFKRVWIHRSRLLSYPSIDIKTLNPFPGVTAASEGLIPLDDALLQWFIENRMVIEKTRIKAGLRLQRGLHVETMEKSEHPEAEWINLLIPNNY